VGIVTAARRDLGGARDDNGPMADSDEHRSVFAYLFGAALGAIALGVTAWVGLRGRRNGGFGMPARRDPRPQPGAEKAGSGPDEDLV
jgi:hypothetical protein